MNEFQLRFADLVKHERHNTQEDVFYWLGQYRALCKEAVAEISRIRDLLLKEGETVTHLWAQERALVNIGSRLAGCLWHFHSTCPECGDGFGKHMAGCSRIYDSFKGPRDSERLFIEAFKLPILPTIGDSVTPNVEVTA